MATYYCPECGKEMVLEDDGDYYCDNCMCYFSVPESQVSFFKNPLSYLIKDIFENPKDEQEQGCKACGNPAYPECKNSCKLFDD